MAIWIDFNKSPRLILVDIDTTEITLQSLIDDIRDVEDEPYAMTYPSVISAAGKEELGGGVTVGITATLENAQVYFAARTTTLLDGTLTTSADPNGKKCISTTSDFVAAGVSRGDLVINDTTMGMATVLSVDSPTQLTTLPISGAFRVGGRNDWQIGDEIVVYTNEQCNISGGNLVAVDEFGAELPPVLQSPNVQVIRTSSASATLQDLESIQAASFNGGISIDTVDGVAGTAFPTGTRQQPVNNLPDAHDIYQERGFPTFFVKGPLDIDSGMFHHGHVFLGENPIDTVITIQDAANIINAEFRNATVTGVLDNGNLLRDCSLGDITHINGYIHQCAMGGKLTLGGNVGDLALIMSCYSAVPGGDTGATSFIDMGGAAGVNLVIRDYHGGTTIENCSYDVDCSIDMSSGRVIFDSTVTAGVFIVRGVGTVTDNSTGTAVIHDYTVKSTADAVADTWNADLGSYTTDGSMGERLHRTSYIDKEIFVDTEALSNGDGTFNSPYDNLADALDDAETNGFRTVVTLADITVDRNLKNFVIRGIGSPAVDIDGQNVDKSEFEGVRLRGIMVGEIVARECVLENTFEDGQGHFVRCALAGDIKILGHAVFSQCYSDIPGLDRPTVTYPTGSSAEVAFRWWSGGLTVLGMDQALDTLTIECTHGKLALDSTCTDGVASIRGVAFFEDNSVGTTVDTSALIHAPEVRETHRITKNKVVTDPVAGTITVYDDDDITVLFSGNLFEDAAGTQGYQGQGAERRERLT